MRSVGHRSRTRGWRQWTSRLGAAAAVVAFVIAAAVGAQESTAQPIDGRGDRDDRGGGQPYRPGPGFPGGRGGPPPQGDPGPYNFGGGYGRGWAMRNPPPTEEEWAEAAPFVQQNSPNRFNALDDMEDWIRERAKGILWSRYQNIQRLKDEDEPLYDLRLRRFQIEDDVFAMARELRGATEDKQGAVREKLRGRVRDLVQNGQDERRLKLESLERRLAEERARLEKDQVELDAVVDGRIEGILERERDFGSGGFPGGGRGMGNLDGTPRDGMDGDGPRRQRPRDRGDRRGDGGDAGDSDDGDGGGDAPPSPQPQAAP